LATYSARVGPWFLHWNPEGSWTAQANGEGHYNFRGRRMHVTRITPATTTTKETP
jgi:hypothetical protein